MEPKRLDLSEIKKRIFESLALEQEQLAKIIAALAIKVEKTARWLPDSPPPGECFSQIFDKAKCMQAVIAQELLATAVKEKAIKGVMREIDGICPPHHDRHHGHYCCPCELFHACKLVGHCLKEGFRIGRNIDEDFDGERTDVSRRGGDASGNVM